MNNPTLNDDLAYVRDLAQAGQQAPLLGGRFLVWWGGLITLAYAGHYSIETGFLDVGSIAFAYLWGGFVVVGFIGYFTLIKTMSKSKPGQSSAGNRVEANVWMIAGFVLSAYFGTLVIKGIIGGETAAGFRNSLPIVFGAYAIALFTSGSMAKNEILKSAGYGALGVVAFATWFSGSNLIWAVAAVGSALTVFLPGLFMLKNEPKDTV